MLFIRGPDQASHISNPELRDLVRRRLLEIVDGEVYDSDIHGEMIVVEPGDTAAALEEQSGCPIMTNPFDGSRLGSPDFVPITEWIEDHGICFEMYLVFTDDGAGVSIFVPKSPGIDAELLALCQQFAESVPTR